MKIEEQIFKDLGIYDSLELIRLANAVYNELYNRNIKFKIKAEVV